MIDWIIMDKPCNEKWNILQKFNILTFQERRNVYALEFLFKYVFTKSLLSPVMRNIFKN